MRINRAIVELVNIFCRCQGLGVPRLVFRIVADQKRNRELIVKKCDMYLCDSKFLYLQV